MAFLPIAGGLWIPLAVLFGVTTLPTYAIAAAHAYDHAPPGGYVATAAGLLLANGVGAIIGPHPRGGPDGEHVDGNALPLHRLRPKRPRALRHRADEDQGAPAVREKTGFDLAATAPVGAVIPPELDPADDLVRAEPRGDRADWTTPCVATRPRDAADPGAPDCYDDRR